MHERVYILENYLYSYEIRDKFLLTFFYHFYTLYFNKNIYYVRIFGDIVVN